MTADATIDYDGLQQEALRGVVRTVLHQVAKSGLPGDHHLYISFDVRAPGVILSKRLREKYPHEMTIVLQHRFWDLAISDERFEVKLTFDGIPERLVVPFNAIKVFLDPSVRYVLHFEEPAGPEADQGRLDGSVAAKPTGDAAPAKKARSTRPKTRSERESAGPGLTAVPNSPAPVSEIQPATALKPKVAPALAPSALAPAASATPATTTAPSANAENALSAVKPQPAGAQVVSLDAFRKK